MLTFGSLFAGIGGIDLGLERAGMRCIWQVEIDEYCNKVLSKHWPDVPKFRDVRSVGAHNLAGVDLIAGGFPCQDISNAGQRIGINGERSGLWSEFYRIIRELRPSYILVENVSALLVRGMGRVLGDLAESGYDAEWQSIPAAAVGAPHIRDRVFILAYSDCPERGPGGERNRTYRTNAGRQEAPGRFAACGADGRTPDVADSASGGWGARRQGRSAASSEGQQEQPLSLLPCNGRSSIFQAPGQTGRILIEGDHAWCVEPDVGRVAHGIPFGLEFLGGRIDEQGNCQETDTATRFACWQVLRTVWEHRELAAASPYLHSERLRDIVPGLPCSGGFARWVAQAEANQELRDLWESFYALPFQEAHDLQQALLERARAEERRQTLAFKQQRVNRLRGLGNAVVPQVAEFVGRCILEAQTTHTTR